jgi:hypothetical protein
MHVFGWWWWWCVQVGGVVVVVASTQHLALWHENRPMSLSWTEFRGLTACHVAYGHVADAVSASLLLLLLLPLSWPSPHAAPGGHPGDHAGQGWQGPAAATGECLLKSAVRSVSGSGFHDRVHP